MNIWQAIIWNKSFQCIYTTLGTNADIAECDPINKLQLSNPSSTVDI